MQSIKYKIKQLSGIILFGITIGISACNEQPEQQHGEVAMDTIPGQDRLIIDTTADISYGTVAKDRKASDETPDLDTLIYIDKGVKPEEAFDEKEQ